MQHLKVGIITIYDLLNYGNRLQNYATVQYLKKIGVEAETLIIHYWSVKDFLNRISRKVLKKEIFKKSKRIRLNYNCVEERSSLFNRLGKNQKIKYNKFKQFSYEYMNIKHVNVHVGDFSAINKAYSYFIVGSDQVWNPEIGRASFDDFLLFAQPQKRISWSASMGIACFSEKDIKDIKSNLTGFKSISVREHIAEKLIEDLTGRNDVETLIDPTMMIDECEWSELAAKGASIIEDESYILVYCLGELTEDIKCKVEEISHKYKLAIVNFKSPNSIEVQCSGPEEFLALIKNARLVITDSFHACVFSILFHTPFCVFRRRGNLGDMFSRIENLLHTFKIEARVLNDNLEEMFNCDFSDADEILKSERKKTEIFLKKALGLYGNENRKN